MDLRLVQPELWLTVLGFAILSLDLVLGRAARSMVGWLAALGLLAITWFAGGSVVTGSFPGDV